MAGIGPRREDDRPVRSRVERPNDGDLGIEFGGEHLLLTPERGVWWPERRTVFVADVHLGKAATFRSQAIPIPDGTEEDLSALDRLLERTAATELVILGDLIHARRGRCQTTFEAVTRWRSVRREISIRLVRGNHDVRAGQPPVAWSFETLREDAEIGPFALRHYPDPIGRPTLAGHLHPKIRLEQGGDRLDLPCFLLRKEVLILPAFTHFADSTRIRREPADQVFPIGGDEVFRI